MLARHAIELALDVARLPALARTPMAPPMPSNIIVLIRIAAGSPKECQEAEALTGEPAAVLIEAARFYLQHFLFRPEADCYRILGIGRDAPRAMARSHMCWLLQWLHPDRNSGLDAIYAERVLKAWREVSASEGHAIDSGRRMEACKRFESPAISRLPLIRHPLKRRGRAAIWAMLASAVSVLALLSSVAYYFGWDRTVVMMTTESMHYLGVVSNER